MFYLQLNNNDSISPHRSYNLSQQSNFVYCLFEIFNGDISDNLMEVSLIIQWNGSYFVNHHIY